ncbi:MAG: hypothetical protein ACRYG7_06390 [Janthinobacterium lividum]
MAYNPRFGPNAQTPAQRARVLAQMMDVLPRLGKGVTAPAQQLYDRYVAGELSWADVRAALDAATAAD